MLDQIIRKDGYKSKSQYGGECTSFACEQAMINLDESPTVGPQIALMQTSIENILNTVSCNDFLTSCRSAIATYIGSQDQWRLNETIMNYQMGFLAPLVNTVIKDEDKPPKPDLSNLGYIGTQGKRGNFFVKLVEIIQKPDYRLHKVVDKKGNRGTFYNYKFKDEDDTNRDRLYVDDCFLMTATPARQEINKFDGGKSTYFNRITILENKGSVAA